MDGCTTRSFRSVLAVPALLRRLPCPMAATVGLRLCQPCAAQSGRAQLVTCSVVVATLSQDLGLSSALHVCTCRGASREPAVLPPPPWCRSWLASRHQSKIPHCCLFPRRLPVSVAGFQWRWSLPGNGRHSRIAPGSTLIRKGVFLGEGELCLSFYVSPRRSWAAKPGHRAVFLPQGLFSLVLALVGSPISHGEAINAGGRALPVCAGLFCWTLGGCPIRAMPWFGVGVSSLALVMYSW